MTTDATYGGPGWRPRSRPHHEELDGSTWSACGLSSEVGPLRQVVLAWPGSELELKEPPDRWLMLRRPDLPRLQAQCEALAAAYERHGVRVHIARPDRPPRPNHIFQRDLFFMTPEGAGLGRPAAQQRAGEERVVAETLARLGVPILRTLRGCATFEGADALWLDDRTVLVGVGLRTNQAAFEVLASVLAEVGAVAVPVPMPSSGIQHLLGVVNFVDRDLAALRPAISLPGLRERLEAAGVQAIELRESDEVRSRGALNFVTLEPRKLLMPADCPRTRARYEAEGIEVHEADVSEYLAAAGGIGCATGILERG